MSHNTGIQYDSSTGIYNNPNQPSFFAFLTTTVTNVTGNGTGYTIVFDTEKHDNQTDFNIATGVYTAPTTGLYDFGVCVSFEGAATSTLVEINLATTLERFRVASFNPAGILNGALVQPPAAVVQGVNMTAGNTASIEVSLSGIGADTADIGGNGVIIITYFSGRLVA